MSRKILYSLGYGSGWSSEMGVEQAKIAIDWPPLVAAVEGGESITKDHPAMKSLWEEMARRGVSRPLRDFGRLRLRVAEVGGPVHIAVYDGKEDVEEPDNILWI